ncbi:MAG: lytic transglycosylase [Pseudomonadota bacterium]
MLRALLITGLVILVGCSSGGSGRAPNSLDNACGIIRERPSYLKAFKAVESKYRVPVATQMAMIHQESKFISDARTPFRYRLGVIPVGRQSSAFGYSQALDGTWDEYLEEAGRWGARRDNIRDATDFMGWYLTKSNERNGIALNDTRRLYLSYHEGHTGYARGSYRAKGWLVNVAKKVEDRAIMYDGQLRACGKI